MSYDLGGCRRPIRYDKLQCLVSQRSEIGSPQTQVRVWLLQPEVAKVPPILVAMMAIGDDMTADVRAHMSIQILEGLINRGIRVISCSHDGTAVERRTQKIIQARYKEQSLKYKILHPANVEESIDVEITVIRGQPLVMVQDSKHALKTYQNNLSSGARALVLSNYTALFRHLGDMVNRGGPAYPRDVFKSDRQDDNAALRIFSSDSVEWYSDCLDHQPEL